VVGRPTIGEHPSSGAGAKFLSNVIRMSGITMRLLPGLLGYSACERHCVFTNNRLTETVKPTPPCVPESEEHADEPRK
jgi:hypothetical protein